MWKWTQSDLSLMQNSMITEVVNFTQFRASVLDHALLISYVDGISFVRERLKVFYRARNYCTPKRNLPLIRRDVNWNQKQQALELLIDAPYFPSLVRFFGEFEIDNASVYSCCYFRWVQPAMIFPYWGILNGEGAISIGRVNFKVLKQLRASKQLAWVWHIYISNLQPLPPQLSHIWKKV